ncbi:MAG: exopolyphosphatase [Planctomycetota bacterium]|nr:exopolyphosphatase [Planctomycetota bacterium]
MTSLNDPETIAAVDLGSNSFHMVIARVMDGETKIVDRVKESVRLGGGLDHEGYLEEEAEKRALSCLKRFGQILEGFDSLSVRAVGTNTLRKAKDKRRFLDKAIGALGHPIEVISGAEEARLVYLGVAHTISENKGRRLVCDIGGGSTECIIGERFDIQEANSLYMGCVAWSIRHFPDGIISPITMKIAELSALQELEPICGLYRSIGWDTAIGSSGTILAVQSIMKANNWCETGISEDGLSQLRKHLVEVGHVEKLNLPGLKPERAAIIPGGVAILSALFEGFGIKEMVASQGALREGLLYDLLGRIHDEDRREATIRVFRDRFHIDKKQAKRVRKTVLTLAQQCMQSWKLDEPMAKKMLAWAAELHEIGQVISYSGYHKHGEYLVRHSDMPGFSKDDQALLAALIRGHRRKISEETFGSLTGSRRKLARRLCVLLRLSVLLNRNRSKTKMPNAKIKVKAAKVSLSFPEQWLKDQPLTEVDLDSEASYLKKIGFELSFR